MGGKRTHGRRDNVTKYNAHSSPPYLRWLLLAAWAVALVGYFGPWIGHPSAALAWNAYDLFDLLRLLPQIENGSLIVNLQALRLPLVGLGVLLPVILAEHRWPWRLAGAALGMALVFATLPPYPEIIGAWRAPGWRIAFWWSIGSMTGAVLAAWLTPRLHMYRTWIQAAWIILTGIPSTITFFRLLPALSELHAAPIKPGWGFWSCQGAMLVIVIISWVRGISQRGSKMSKIDNPALEQIRAVKAHYEPMLMRKANVVGVGIGLRQSDNRLTDQLALVVNVTHKVPWEELSQEARIPRNLNGIPVDVQVTGDIMAQE